jgi:uncharacterized protein (TIGR00661 family)
MKRSPVVMVAPLDWGLGHATRCIPIINELLRQDAQVIIAAYGRSQDLLKKEFPSLKFVRLPGFLAAYPSHGNMALKMVASLPKIFATTLDEHSSLKKAIADMNLDAIISDSRFGLFSKKIPCVYLTHQTRIMMPPSLSWAERMVSAAHRSIIRRYRECWIPDTEGKENLSGDLSHYYPVPRNATFIGPLSRFNGKIEQQPEYEIVVILSGPEPQRSIIENRITEQLKSSAIKTLLIRGLPEQNQRIQLSDTLTVISALTSEKLLNVIAASNIIISRPGYSSIMDLNALRKKAIFIPTPGQTEQEYLARLFETRKIAYYETQDQFTLNRALDKSKEYTGFSGADTNQSRLSEKVQHLLSLIH